MLFVTAIICVTPGGCEVFVENVREKCHRQTTLLTCERVGVADGSVYEKYPEQSFLRDGSTPEPTSVPVGEVANESPATVPVPVGEVFNEEPVPGRPADILPPDFENG